MDVANSPGADSGGTRILTLDDEGYPPLLRLIHDPPERLWVRGEVEALRAPLLAVVGSRKASPAGLRVAEALAAQAVDAGLQICSGLALGIDGAAHRGTLAAGGKSVAVMATGLDRVYPARHRTLAEEMVQAGCLVTEFPPGTPPRRQHFPRRNRIVSGLSLGVLVVEAALPSGSLITARTALDQGREVFALPWSVLHAGGAGCLYLIRDGAKMVQGIDDIVEELGSLYALHRSLSDPVDAAPPSESPLYPLIGFEASTVDELIRCSGLPAATVLAELSTLELEGLVERSVAGYIRS